MAPIPIQTSEGVANLDTTPEPWITFSGLKVIQRPQQQPTDMLVDFALVLLAKFVFTS